MYWLGFNSLRNLSVLCVSAMAGIKETAGETPRTLRVRREEDVPH